MMLNCFASFLTLCVCCVGGYSSAEGAHGKVLQSRATPGDQTTGDETHSHTAQEKGLFVYLLLA